MKTLELAIDPFTDTADVAHLEKTLEAVPHVRSVEIDPKSRRARVEHDGVDEQELTSALRELGYRANVT